MANVKLTPMEASDDLDLKNMFMTFHFEDGEVARFGYVITAKSFWTFVGSNNEGLLKEEEVTFPSIFMHGSTRRVLVHYVEGKKFACYVPVFPTQAEAEKYSATFDKRRKK